MTTRTTKAKAKATSISTQPAPTTDGARAIVREFFPAEPDSVIDYVLWEWTGYPVTPVDCLRAQLASLQAWCYGRAGA